MSGILEVVNPPAATALDLDDVKAALIVQHADDDLLITSYIKAATTGAETFLNRALIDRDLCLHLDCFRDRVALPQPPLGTVSAVKYDDAAGDEQTLSDSFYEFPSVGLGPGWLQRAPGKSWPALTSAKAISRVRIEYSAGYGAVPAAIPEDIRQGLIYWVAHLYEIREPVVVGVSVAEVPMTTVAHLSPHRIRRL